MPIVRNSKMHFDTLTAAIANDGTLDNCYVVLFTNDVTPSPADEYLDYELAEATGVAAAQPISWGDVSDDNGDGYTVLSGLHTFRRGNDEDPAEAITGLLVFRQDGYEHDMRFVQVFDEPISLANTLDSVNVVLKYGEGLSAEVTCSIIE